MGEESKPTARPWSIPVAIISIVVAALLGLAVGSKVDELVSPAFGPTGATVAGFGTALAVFAWVGVVSYRALTR